jgi:metallo-beta-lactamase family protein
MKLTFHGAARTVTGSKHLLTLDSGRNVLLDCGFFQGHGADTDALNRTFPFDPSRIDVVILSHAHIDHSGNIPNLVKQGFKGEVFCTEPTLDLCRIMLADTAHIQENDVSYLNKRRVKKGLSWLKPIYDIHDVEKALPRFRSVPFNHDVRIFDELTLRFTEAGHILGAAAVNLEIRTGSGTTRLFFSGDIGRYGDKILKAPEPFPQADYVICESTYGNRLHESLELTASRLIGIVNDTCVKRKGKLIIPAFSLGRTQELVYSLNKLSNQGLLPHIQVYVDSPLSVNATEIMRRHTLWFNQQIIDELRDDPDPFGFNGLHYIQDVNQSKALNGIDKPCIIISASGMAEAGRIKHHIKNTISHPENTLLIVGFCTPESLGGRLLAGHKEVRIFGEEYRVRARVEVINAFSAHGDYNEMLRYLSCQDPDAVKQLFLVHGEYDVQVDWREKLVAAGFRHVEIPEKGSVHAIR